MGWSLSKAANDVLDVWTAFCIKQTGSQNSYIGTDGQNHFYETSRTEHPDGAVTGSTQTEIKNSGGYYRRSGSFRINGDGTVRSYPTAWPGPRVQK